MGWFSHRKIRSTNVDKAYGTYEKDTVQVDIDDIPRCTDDAVQLVTAEGLVWIPRSQLDYADCEEGSAHMSLRIAVAKGLV